MPWWIVQWYGYAPGASTVHVNTAPGESSPDVERVRGHRVATAALTLVQADGLARQHVDVDGANRRTARSPRAPRPRRRSRRPAHAAESSAATSAGGASPPRSHASPAPSGRPPRASIHGWMRHMKYSFVPFVAVTLRSIDSPFLPSPVTPESPGRSTFGAVVLPGAVLQELELGRGVAVGIGAVRLAQLVADLAVERLGRRLRQVLPRDHRERVRAFRRPRC